MLKLDSLTDAKTVGKIELIVLDRGARMPDGKGNLPYESFVNSIDPTGRIKVIYFPTRFGKFGIESMDSQAVEIGKNDPT